MESCVSLSFTSWWSLSISFSQDSLHVQVLIIVYHRTDLIAWFNVAFKLNAFAAGGLFQTPES